MNQEPTDDHWGVEVRLRREDALITQRDLAAAVGVSQALVSKIERSGITASHEIRTAIDRALEHFSSSRERRRRNIIRRALQKLSVLELRALELDPAALLPGDPSVVRVQE